MLFFAAVRKNFLLHAPVEHIPAVLHDIDAPRLHARFDLAELEVGKSYRLDLALLDEVIEGAHRLFEWHVTVRPVNEVDIDVVSLECF